MMYCANPNVMDPHIKAKIVINSKRRRGKLYSLTNRVE